MCSVAGWRIGSQINQCFPARQHRGVNQVLQDCCDHLAELGARRFETDGARYSRDCLVLRGAEITGYEIDKRHRDLGGWECFRSAETRRPRCTTISYRGIATGDGVEGAVLDQAILMDRYRNPATDGIVDAPARPLETPRLTDAGHDFVDMNRPFGGDDLLG